MKMNSKQNFRTTLNHRNCGKIVVDFGATSVTGIHVKAIENLRRHYGLPMHPVKVTEPYQMLGEIEPDLAEILGIDVIGIPGRTNIFGFESKNFREFKTFWGQVVLVPEGFQTVKDKNGDLLIFPEGDTSVAPSARMPKLSYFFDAIIRQKPFKEEELNPDDNTEEFKLMSEAGITYWKDQAKRYQYSDKGIIAGVGGTALGDIALVPGPFMKDPRGIRDVAEWYLSTLTRQDYIHKIFSRQTEIALKNLKSFYDIMGETIEAIYICGTDFGTQDSLFCDPGTFDELYAPYYKQMNDWVHKHTSWKTFKHSCGAVVNLLPNIINCGFDIINPVQTNATGMSPGHLKSTYGDQLVFWGGGMDTQKILPFGNPESVREEVLRKCDIFGRDGGFVFNTVHNTQANVPVENLAAMIDTLNEINK